MREWIDDYEYACTYSWGMHQLLAHSHNYYYAASKTVDVYTARLEDIHLDSLIHPTSGSPPPPVSMV